MLRLTGGKWRSRKLWAPAGKNTRPTAAHLRERLFDICGPFDENSRFLDLYAGSGACGLEALSRGAGEVIFVDNCPKAVSCIRKNLAALEAKAKVLSLSVKPALFKLKGPFDIIYVDPPYAAQQNVEIAEIIAKQNLLGEDGILIFEEEKHHASDFTKSSLNLLETRKIGDLLLHLLTPKR
ncbi:MAG: 16S rRNA (guanine(966)-N(2))-methyltransferase RsmD [Simkaniaceae bacterium]|nr:16S rRNA (guanine(966)-N(2))-methyltransferase RsmD [Simkaniaceae bacterium]